MAQWTVNGKTYAAIWIHPARWETAYACAPTISLGDAEAGEAVTGVFVVDDSVSKDADYLQPPLAKHTDPRVNESAAHVAAVKAQTAVGNILKSRERIDFLRLVRAYPYGMEPDAQGQNGGGDPRADANQQAKRRPLQPGEFPADRKDDGPGLGTVIATAIVVDALTRSERRVSDDNKSLREAGQTAEQQAARNGTTLQQELDKERSPDADPGSNAADTQQTDAAPPIVAPEVPPASTYTDVAAPDVAVAAPEPAAAPDYSSAAPDYASAAPSYDGGVGSFGGGE
jgi:hypothetical protein